MAVVGIALSPIMGTVIVSASYNLGKAVEGIVAEHADLRCEHCHTEDRIA